MKVNRSIITIMAVAGLGYAAGQLELFPSAVSIAAPGDRDEDNGPGPEIIAMEEAGALGEHHKMLQPLIGEFDGEWTIWMDPAGAPFTSRGTVTREWVLDGHYVRETVEADTDWGHFSGIGYIGYNNVDGQYECIWMDSHSTAILRESGTIDPDTMIMRTTATMRDPASGKMLASRGTFDLSSPGRQKFVGYVTGPDGREFKHMESVSERR